jgi:hypothetical protein
MNTPHVILVMICTATKGPWRDRTIADNDESCMCTRVDLSCVTQRACNTPPLIAFAWKVEPLCGTQESNTMHTPCTHNAPGCPNSLPMKLRYASPPSAHVTRRIILRAHTSFHTRAVARARAHLVQCDAALDTLGGWFEHCHAIVPDARNTHVTHCTSSRTRTHMSASMSHMAIVLSPTSA